MSEIHTSKWQLDAMQIEEIQGQIHHGLLKRGMKSISMNDVISPLLK